MQLKRIARALLPLTLAASSFGQAPTAPKVTNVMATLTLKDGITREQLVRVMQSEVHDTVNLYLEGKIQQWFARGDGKGVVFILDCKTVEEAKATLEKLPLIKANFASFDYMPLGPLSPLRLLLSSAPSSK